MEAIEVIHAQGHENIRSTHMTTFEITKEPTVTRHGDCIIAVNATKSAADFHPEFRRVARNENAKITIRIEAGRTTDIVEASGTRKLLFTHPTDVVVRRSDYVCDRTTAIKADKAAVDFSRKLVEKLRTSSQRIRITFTAESY